MSDALAAVALGGSCIVLLTMISDLRPNGGKGLLMFGAFVPFVSLLVLIYVLSETTKVLKAAGYKVELRGVSSADLKVLAQRAGE